MPETGETRDGAFGAVLGAATGMLEFGLTTGTSGNVSARLDDGLIVITPSSLPYRDMTADDLVVLTMDGEQVSGRRAPSSEKSLHLACYRAFDEVGAVLHSHPAYATMFACARMPVPAVLDEAVIFAGGEIPVTDYAMSGSPVVGQNAVAVLGAAGSALLANHGLVTIAASPSEALNQAAVVEHCAQVAWGVRALGGHVPLPPEALESFAATYRRSRWSIS
ncbi:MAG: class II aldolase/adducin family protein [Micromonosporaceae bacterium]